jgi:hypothetical protein
MGRNIRRAAGGRGCLRVVRASVCVYIFNGMMKKELAASIVFDLVLDR